MNPHLPFGSLVKRSQTTYHDVRRSRFMRDRLSVGIIIAASIINLATYLSLLGSVRPGTQGAVRYSSLYVGYTLGVWYYPFLVALFATVVIIVNAVLAYQTYARSRLASFFLITGSLVVALFCLVIGNALGAAR